MKAVTFDVTIPRYVLGKTLGRFTDWAVFGAPSGVSYGDVKLPELPGDGWLVLDVLSCGICGTDIGNLTFRASPALEPFGSFPAVPGHEILARVWKVGVGVTRVQPGQRVAVDPALSCAVRGFDEEPCPSCADALPLTCERAGEEGRTRIEIGSGPGSIGGEDDATDGRAPSAHRLAPGMMIGYHADLPGGWGERMVVHESQLHPVDDALGDRHAVLIEPLSIGMHAVLNSDVRTDEPVLVIGSGPIALGTVWALRATGFEGYLLAQAKRPHEQELARRLGATEVVAPGHEAREALIGTGARAYQPMVGPEVYAGGGFPLIFDCVGSAGSLSQALRFASPRGRIVMLGCAARIPRLDLTWVWARELKVKGFVGYGTETFRGRRQHTFRITHDLLLESGAPVGDMVTHVFPLDHYRDALYAASNHRRSGAVKVVLQP